jgi:hypothetical protein
MTLASTAAALPAHTHAPTASRDVSRYRVVPARYPARILGSVFAAAVIGTILYAILANPRWGWDVFAQWFFAEPVLIGLGRTLLLTLLGTVFGFLLGTLLALALARVSGSPLLAALSWGYAWLFRSIPLIVLLLILNNLGYLYATNVIVQPHAQLAFVAARDRDILQVGTLSAGWPLRSDVAVATRRGSGLADALTAATNTLIDDGTYDRMLDRWGLAAEALPRSATNPPGLPKD